MADYREFLRILANQEPGRAVGFEYAWERGLAERLLWRKGGHLWAGEKTRVRSLAETALRCRMDCVALELSEEDGVFPGLEGLSEALPEGMRAAAGMRAGFFETGGELGAFRRGYEKLAGDPAVCAVIIRDRGEAVPGKEAFRKISREITAAVHGLGKPCIWADCGQEPVPLDWAAQCGFDAVHLTGAYTAETAEIWREYHQEFALLGDTRLSWLKNQEPAQIIAYCEYLQALTGNKGFAFGMGNPQGEPVPYLSYISTISALVRRQ